MLPSGKTINSQSLVNTQVRFTSHHSLGPIRIVLEHFTLYKLSFQHVDRHVGHLVHLHVGHHIGHQNVVSTLCEGSETLIEWKSETLMDGRTDGVGARDT